MLINRHGHEVPVNHFTYRQLVDTGRIEEFQRRVMKSEGNGNPKNICIILNNNGLGDDINAMPAIAQKIADGYNVTVTGRAFTRKCFESLGCRFIYESEADAEFISKHNDEYGTFYSMAQWCLEHDFYSGGNLELSYHEQFAKYIETTLPKKFSFGKYLTDESSVPKREEVVFGLTASTVIRSYPNQMTLARMFEGKEKVRILGGLFPRAMLSSFDELVDVVYNAKLVIGVSSGILMLALALGTPCVAVFGPADERFVVEPFGRFRDMGNVKVVRTTKRHECMMPCSFQETRGHGVNGKCASDETFSDCMLDVTPEEIFNCAKQLL